MGQSLRRVLQDGALDWGRSCKIVLQASDALHSAHLQDIVHRDVKPDNIMLCGEGASESVKVIDFGLAGKIGAVDGFDTLTSPGKIFGTPNYMPPEAFSGAATN
ncbi:MAG: protein kinase [Candidatus Obscuribacterales bacterium]|nr:protein kinase [Candidatus Obscuribacterales bacterium]